MRILAAACVIRPPRKAGTAATTAREAFSAGSPPPPTLSPRATKAGLESPVVLTPVEGGEVARVDGSCHDTDDGLVAPDGEGARAARRAAALRTPRPAPPRLSTASSTGREAPSARRRRARHRGRRPSVGARARTASGAPPSGITRSRVTRLCGRPRPASAPDRTLDAQPSGGTRRTRPAARRTPRPGWPSPSATFIGTSRSPPPGPRPRRPAPRPPRPGRARPAPADCGDLGPLERRVDREDVGRGSPCSSTNRLTPTTTFSPLSMSLA